MHILFLSPRFPLPTVKGDKLRAWQFIRLLSTKHDVTLVSYISTQDEYWLKPEVEKVCRVITEPFRALSRGFGLLSGCIKPDPFQALLFESCVMKRHVGDLLKECDVVHCNTLRMAPNIPEGLDVPLVVDFVDALSGTYQRRAKDSVFPVSLVFTNEARRLGACEKSLIDKAAFTCAVSDEDADALGDNVLVVSHGIDTDEFCQPESKDQRNDIIFTGNLNYPPNIAAARTLARDIFPKVCEVFPQNKLRLVGTSPSAEVKDLAGPRIEVTGFVPSVAHELQRSAVAVAPVESGGGVKTKILEAMGCATPVVATTMANAGISAEHGREIILADGPSTIAEQIVALLEDRDKAREIGEAGRRLVEEKFSWLKTGSVILERYAELEQSLK